MEILNQTAKGNIKSNASLYEQLADTVTKVNMPINDANVYAEKSSSAGISKSVKTNNAHTELQALLTPSSNCSTSTKYASDGHASSSLIKYQGQKWQTCLDFDKILKQIRNAEKQHLRDNKNDNATAGNNGKSTANVNNHEHSPPKTALLKCSGQHVQRLSGSDMHYYGIVPKQTALGVVVCNVCIGIYTKMGFNNHMMLQHPTIWSTVSTKPNDLPTTNESGNALAANDNSQDSIREVAVLPDNIVGSPSDLSGTMSTCSNASTSSSLSSAYSATARHKSSKTGSSSGGSSSSSGVGRSRNKSKHHVSSSSSPSVHHNSVSSSSTSGDTAQQHTNTSKSAKKSSTVSHTTAIASAAATASATLNVAKESNITAAATSNHAGVMEAISIYSTSSASNSSSSLTSMPPTPKATKANGTGEAKAASGSVVVQSDSTYATMGVVLPLKETKEKPTVSDATALVTSAKKKARSPSFIGGKGGAGGGQESVDSTTSNSTSSEYERAGLSTKSTSSKACTFPMPVKAASSSKPIVKKQMIGKVLKHMDAQLDELDQAVSSITGGLDSKIDVSNESSMDMSVINTNMATSSASSAYKMQAIADVTVAAPALLANNNYATQDATQSTCDEQMPHNSSDDNSILMLEDVLDSKFINDILNTAESEMHFDEHELDSAAQQNYLQQPATKRMRYSDGQHTASAIAATAAQAQQQQQSNEMTNEFVVFQQQQQFPAYDGAHLDDIKMFNTADNNSKHTSEQQYATQQEQHQQQQQQITSIDAMQLQQLLYQQQQQQHINAFTAGIEDPAAAITQHAQFEQAGIVNAKQMIDLCAESDETLAKNVSVSTTLAPICGGNAYESGATCQPTVTTQFEIFNVPSLTDDIMTEDIMPLVETALRNGQQQPHQQQQQQQQYVLPPNEEQLIYEITTNNQVAVMSQQRQQQMIAEFLTQAGYENAENINATAIEGVSNNSLWDYASSDLLDFDFTRLDTVKPLTSSNNSNTAASESKSAIKSEYSAASKFSDDFYFNVFIYAGIPRPLAINCFGLIKLPQATAITFRKNLLTTRKANNSLITLGGSINGVVGTNAAAVTATASRFGNANTKPVSNYFTALAGGSGNVTNEFSIGSITITNSPTLTQSQLYAQQKQQNAAGPGSVEITFHANANGGSSATSPVSTLQRARPKQTNAVLSGGGSLSSNTMNNLAKIKSTLNSSNMSTITPTSAAAARQTGIRNAAYMPTHNSKTIYVSSAGNIVGDNVKFTKRSLIAKVDLVKKSHFTAKQIAEMLSLGKNVTKHNHQQQQQQPSQTDNNAMLERDTASQQLKLNRVNHFYERRRKLLHLTNHSARQHQLHQNPLIKEKLLKQQLVKTLTNCSIGGKGNNGSSEVMRVFV